MTPERARSIVMRAYPKDSVLVQVQHWWHSGLGNETEYRIGVVSDRNSGREADGWTGSTLEEAVARALAAKRLPVLEDIDDDFSTCLPVEQLQL